jgi:hypothetical protein
LFDESISQSLFPQVYLIITAVFFIGDITVQNRCLTERTDMTDSSDFASLLKASFLLG